MMPDVRCEEAVRGSRRWARFPIEKPGMAGSRALGIRVGCRVGAVRRRIAQHVSALRLRLERNMEMMCVWMCETGSRFERVRTRISLFGQNLQDQDFRARLDSVS